jgi:hypothetical protein
MESLGIAHKNDESQLRNRFPCLVYHISPLGSSEIIGRPGARESRPKVALEMEESSLVTLVTVI